MTSSEGCPNCVELQANRDFDRRQFNQQLTDRDELHEYHVKNLGRLDAAAMTVAERVWKAAMQRRKVVRVDELLAGLPQVTI